MKNRPCGLFACLAIAACQSNSSLEYSSQGAVNDPPRGGGEFTFLELVRQCTLDTGMTFLYDEETEREMERLRSSFTFLGRTSPPPPDLVPSIGLDALKQMILRADAMGSVHLTLEPFGPGCTNTYAICRRNDSAAAPR